MIIISSSEEQHLANLRAVLFRLKEYGLKIKLKEVRVFKSDDEFLGHVINEKGVHKSPSKVEAILNCSRPENVTKL